MMVYAKKCGFEWPFVKLENLKSWSLGLITMVFVKECGFGALFDDHGRVFIFVRLLIFRRALFWD